MIGTSHNPVLQGGGWMIQCEPPEFKKDRSQAVVYRLRGIRRRRRADWTPSEEYAYKNDLWIPEVVSDHIDDLSRPPHERPGVVRLMQVWLCYGGLLVDSLDELGDDLTQALVVREYNRCNRRVVANNGVVGAERRERLIIRAGGAEAVQAATDQVVAAAYAQLQKHWAACPERPFLVGSGEPRDYSSALDYAECLRMDGVGLTERIRRLNLEGWENARGIRRWNTHNVPGTPA